MEKKEPKVKLIYVLLPGKIEIEFRLMNVETSLKVSITSDHLTLNVLINNFVLQTKFTRKEICRQTNFEANTLCGLTTLRNSFSIWRAKVSRYSYVRFSRAAHGFLSAFLTINGSTVLLGASYK